MSEDDDIKKLEAAIDVLARLNPDGRYRNESYTIDLTDIYAGIASLYRIVHRRKHGWKPGN